MGREGQAREGRPKAGDSDDRQRREQEQRPRKRRGERAGAKVTVRGGVLRDECALLYNEAVRAEVARLRGATAADLERLQDALSEKRRAWCEQRPPRAQEACDDPLGAAYELFLAKLGLRPDDTPVVLRTPDRLVIHSRNFCPTLEACKLLRLDTRVVCRAVTERPADVLVKHIDPRLTFNRNYGRLRPYADACEEIIAIAPPIATSGHVA